MTPWLQQVGIKIVNEHRVSAVNMMKSSVTSEPHVCAVGGGRGKYHSVEGDLPHCPVVQGALGGESVSPDDAVSPDVEVSPSHQTPRTCLILCLI